MDTKDLGNELESRQIALMKIGKGWFYSGLVNSQIALMKRGKEWFYSGLQEGATFILKIKQIFIFLIFSH